MNACMHAQSLLFSVALRIFLPRPCPLPAILLVTPNWGHQLRHGHCGRLAHSGAVDARAIVRVPVERESCDKADHLQIAGVVANALARLTFPNPPGELPRGQSSTDRPRRNHARYRTLTRVLARVSVRAYMALSPTLGEGVRRQNRPGQCIIVGARGSRRICKFQAREQGACASFIAAR